VIVIAALDYNAGAKAQARGEFTSELFTQYRSDIGATSEDKHYDISVLKRSSPAVE
jgi:hypothetical protein